jgi:Tat protein secretion system quality control protein TatD with DNase activity
LRTIIRKSAEKIAEIKGITLEEVYLKARANTKLMYGI